MRALAQAIFLAVPALLGPLAAAAQSGPVNVTIDGTPVHFDQPPVEEAGRVYVPLRGVFERLGASVVYDRGRINATRGATTVSLSVGSTAATVNGIAQRLDNPPITTGLRVLVPLRFVSQALGATVNFIHATQTVAIGAPAVRSLPRRPLGAAAAPVAAPAAPAANTGLLSAINPGPNTVAVPRVAQITAHFTTSVEPNSVHATLDGADITSQILATAHDFVYSITGPLAVGAHTVAITGNLVNGQTFHNGWTFRTIYAQ